MADWLTDNFFSSLRFAEAADDHAQLSEAMRRAYLAADRACLKRFEFAGCTAVTVALDLVTGNLVVGNVGDSLAILVHLDSPKDSDHTVLTRNHRLADDDERQRVLDAGGWITKDNRVFDCLQPTRTLGDDDMKKRGIPPRPLNRKETKKLAREGKTDDRPHTGDASKVIIAEPHVHTLSIPRRTPAALVLGSDGLWDYVSPAEVSRLVSNWLRNAPAMSAETIARQLCEAASSRKSCDDISAIVCIVDLPCEGKEREPQAVKQAAVPEMQEHDKAESISKPDDHANEEKSHHSSPSEKTGSATNSPS